MNIGKYESPKIQVISMEPDESIMATGDQGSTSAMPGTTIGSGPM